MSKFKTKSWLAAVGGLLLATTGSAAFAVADNELGPNVGGLAATVAASATAVPAGDGSITGDLYTQFSSTDTFGDEDAFSFYLDGVTAFTANIALNETAGTNLGAPFKPVLTLLENDGGVWRKRTANDPGITTNLSYNGAAGNYLLLVSQFNNAPLNGAGQILTPVAFNGAVWANMEHSAAVGPASWGYDVTISGTAVAPAVPVPAAVWLFGSGLMGLVGVARRRKA